ncbi:hypothetical protein FF011L_17860 [Roseimaritima multifibrata]|uniref:Uncharacterized protein n=1 Tax=Roseimaritima multifibrata TaxID=1930274 RepID=A0A517MDR7_9BACT|nr:hypothetical protein FF011L_17860 [Roseimaritima multifibrata]
MRYPQIAPANDALCGFANPHDRGPALWIPLEVPTKAPIDVDPNGVHRYAYSDCMQFAIPCSLLLLTPDETIVPLKALSLRDFQRARHPFGDLFLCPLGHPISADESPAHGEQC